MCKFLDNFKEVAFIRSVSEFLFKYDVIIIAIFKYFTPTYDSIKKNRSSASLIRETEGSAQIALRKPNHPHFLSPMAKIVIVTSLTTVVKPRFKKKHNRNTLFVLWRMDRQSIIGSVLPFRYRTLKSCSLMILLI